MEPIFPTGGHSHGNQELGQMLQSKGGHETLSFGRCHSGEFQATDCSRHAIRNAPERFVYHGGSISGRLRGGRRASCNPHAESGPHRERGSAVPKCLFQHAELHTGPVGPVDGPRSLAKRNAWIRASCRTISHREAARVARGGLLHVRHRQDALVATTESAWISWNAAG